jgi:translation initiation factor 2 beta subunit (eIF-2beta)/eIF-5
MNKIIDKIKNIYNTFGQYIFSNDITCLKSNNITLQDNKYIIINNSGLYYVHIYNNIKLIHININNKKTLVNAINMIHFSENDIINKYNNDFFNMLICKEPDTN